MFRASLELAFHKWADEHNVPARLPVAKRPSKSEKRGAKLDDDFIEVQSDFSQSDSVDSRAAAKSTATPTSRKSGSKSAKQAHRGRKPALREANGAAGRVYEVNDDEDVDDDRSTHVVATERKKWLPDENYRCV